MHAGYSPDQAGLLYIRRALPNFQTYKRRALAYGWDDEPGSRVCAWTGVQCTNGSVTGLHFTNNGSVLAGETGRDPCCLYIVLSTLLAQLLLERDAHLAAAASTCSRPESWRHGGSGSTHAHARMGWRAGNVADVLHGASLIPNLQAFDISFQALTGTLPDVQLPTVQILDLSNNYLQARPLPGCTAALMDEWCRRPDDRCDQCWKVGCRATSLLSKMWLSHLGWRR